MCACVCVPKFFKSFSDLLLSTVTAVLGGVEGGGGGGAGINSYLSFKL